MEQVGTSGLPPLLPSVPVPVPVADSEQSVEQVVEEDLCSLTELVPVRSKQHTSATDRILAVEEELVDDPLEGEFEEDTSEMQEDLIISRKAELKNSMVSVKKLESTDEFPVEANGVNSVDATSETLSETTSETHSEARSEPQSEPSSATHINTAYHLPPHLLGRTVENPAADIPPGRRMQKPRLGVRVPYRNLTSQIVTQDEIAQELFERAAKKYPSLADKEGINSKVFSRQLTQRLASSIHTPPLKPKTAIVPDSIGALKALLPSKAPAAPAVDGLRLSPGFTYSEKNQAMDDAELLSILEGDGDPLWLPDKLLRKPDNSTETSSPAPPNPTTSPSLPVAPQPPPLDPEVEKELALKQLMELPIAFPSKKLDKKDKQEKRPAKRRRGKGKEDIPNEGANLPPPEPATVDTATASDPKQADIVSNGGGTEKVPIDEMPLKKITSSRKRKMTPEVAAVLKKTKITKKAEAVIKAEGVGKIDNPPKQDATSKTEVVGKIDLASKAEAVAKNEAARKAEAVSNGKGKGGKSTSNQSTPVESGKKRAASNKKTPPPKNVELLVTNGSSEANSKKRTPKRAVKAKQDETNEKKSPTKTSPPKTTKGSKAASKSPALSKAQAQSGTHHKSTEATNEVTLEIPKDLPMEVVEEEEAPILEPAEEVVETQPLQKKPTRVNRELEYLLGDEGAVNMLYAVEGHKRRVSSKDLALKARLVKTAVMRLSTSPQGHMPLALRARRSLNVTEPPKLVKMGGNRKQRHHSSESLDSMRSPPYLTPVEGASSNMYTARQKLTADDSRIIRRHSSSSSFSSPSVSPRRVSVEDANSQGVTASAAAASQGSSGTPRKRGVPIFVRDKTKTQTYDGRKKKKVALNPLLLKDKLLELHTKKLLLNPAALKSKDQRKIISEANSRTNAEFLKKLKKGLDRTASPAMKKLSKLQKAKLLAEKKAAEEISKAQRAAEKLLQAQQEIADLVDDNTLPEAVPVIKQEGKKNNAPQSPNAASVACECTFDACLASCATCVMGPLFCVSPTGYSNLLKSLHPKAKKNNAEERQRSTVRHCAGTYNYKEITVRRYDSVVHVILSPVSTKLSSSFNVQVLRELRDALQQVRKDDQCRVVLLTSSGSIFCQGIDLCALIHNNNEKRKTAAFEMSLALKDFLKCIAHFPKPLIAGVQGAAVGLAVTMLPLFDMVFASDKATFHTPYAQIGQVPEGGATLTLPHMLGHTATSELLLNCRKLTANEALQYGLVTRVLWPDRFLEELIPVVKNIAQQSAQSMEATKALLRHGLRTKFDAALESETHLLVEHWTSKECQTSFQRLVDTGEVCLQRQRSDA